MDPTAGGLTAIAVAYLGKDGVAKLLGPTAEYFGEGLRGLVEQRVNNFQSILIRAHRKVGAEIEQAGSVPARVLKDVLDEGTFSDDPISLKYFAGVVASSRTPGGVDDRGIRISKIISRLSRYQMRGHYLIYRSIVDNYFGSGKRFSNVGDRKSMVVYIPLRPFLVSMGIFDQPTALDIFGHTLHGLMEDGLIDSWLVGTNDVLRKKFRNAPPRDGLVYKPSLAGAEVFNFALGRGNVGLDFLSSEKTPKKAFDEELTMKDAIPLIGSTAI